MMREQIEVNLDVADFVRGRLVRKATQVEDLLDFLIPFGFFRHTNENSSKIHQFRDIILAKIPFAKKINLFRASLIFSTNLITYLTEKETTELDELLSKVLEIRNKVAHGQYVLNQGVVELYDKQGNYATLVSKQFDKTFLVKNENSFDLAMMRLATLAGRDGEKKGAFGTRFKKENIAPEKFKELEKLYRSTQVKFKKEFQENPEPNFY